MAFKNHTKDELPCRSQEDGDHCWHVTGALTVNPPIAIETCCWCGCTRREPPSPLAKPQHGPHAS